MNAPARIDTSKARPYAGFTSSEYAQMVSSGAFGDLRVELVRGELRKMMPSDWQHGESNVKLAALLLPAFKSIGARVGSDVIIELTPDTTRAADVVVVKPDFTGKRLKPSDILMVVEIANTSLGIDLGEKADDYAAAGIAECWVIDVNGSSIHVMTKPSTEGYDQRKVFRFGEPLPVPGTDTAITID